MQESDFYQRVYEIVRKIPKGKVSTYGHIARVLGMKISARMVGWALNSIAFQQTDIPAHRVVNRKGELTGSKYFPPPTFMRDLLISEGVTFVEDRVDLSKHLWLPDSDVIFED
ncbi:MAG: MGMT family protein [Candidatus Kapaibacteriota bacterium]